VADELPWFGPVKYGERPPNAPNHCLNPRCPDPFHSITVHHERTVTKLPPMITMSNIGLVKNSSNIKSDRTGRFTYLCKPCHDVADGHGPIDLTKKQIYEHVKRCHICFRNHWDVILSHAMSSGRFPGEAPCNFYRDSVLMFEPNTMVPMNLGPEREIEIGLPMSRAWEFRAKLPVSKIAGECPSCGSQPLFRLLYNFKHVPGNILDMDHDVWEYLGICPDGHLFIGDDSNY